MLVRVLLAAALATVSLNGQANCVNFPAGLVPLSSINYVTAANPAGDHLVFGALANGLNSLTAIPASGGTNQLFCDATVQLGPQQFFPGVYVPTSAERSGVFPAFNGLLVDPATNQPFSGGTIPAGKLGSVYAFRISATQVPQASRLWNPTGAPASYRYQAPAVLLPNGKVLVAAGLRAPAGADLYDPQTGRFASRPTLSAHGEGATATLLNDGRVLLVGDAGPAELYDPVADKFQATGSTSIPRKDHTATLLNDGRVLIAGGIDGSSVSIAGAEIYDPATGTFQTTGAMNTARGSGFAVLLQDGRVLVMGGIGTTSGAGPITSAELFDPKTGKFAKTGDLQIGRLFAFATRLPNGKVLVLSGCNDPTVEIYDPSAGLFSVNGALQKARFFNSAAILSSGLVLVSGGTSTPFVVNESSAELYDPGTGISTETAGMTIPREMHSSTRLLDGRVLIIGGSSTRATLDLISSAEIYTPVQQGLVSSQTGLTFRAAQGAGALTSQTVAILSPTDTIPFTVSVKTFTGGNWLKATPGGGTSGPGAAPVVLTISADATGLSATDYYGTVTLTPTDGKHPPISIAVVLTIVPAGTPASPGVFPAGLVFRALTGTSPKAQTFSIANVTSKALTFTGAATQNTTFFDFTPKTGSIAAGQSQTITVTPSSATLAAGVYRGSIKLSFGDGSTQSVDVLLVASATAGPSPERGAAACTPTKLLPVLTSVGAGFSTPVAWPTALIVQVVDDCASPVIAGAVTVSFTSGDAPLSLLSIGGGAWSATWVPVRSSSSTVIRADARSSVPSLTGTVQVSGQVAANPKVPVVAAGGVLSSGDYTGSPAQGLLASIFGVALADGALGNSSLPLPPQLGSTSVFVSGVSLPMLYVSENQVNVLIPYELAVNAPHQLIVQRGNAISVPVPIPVFENQSAILATAGNGQGQGHVYVINSANAQILADASAPAKAGDVLVLYTVGLGPVNPPLKSGDPAPFDKLENITGTASLTIGGVPAQVLFAGLTPGFAGLYQINAIVPAGVTPGSQVPVTIAVNGRASAGAISMAVQ